MESEISLKNNNNSFLNNSGLVLNNIADIFYISIVQIFIALFISFILDKFIYKHYDNEDDEDKNIFLLLVEFALMSACIATLSFGISKLLIYLPFPFNNTLHTNFNFNHESNVINKNDGIMTIILFVLCKPLQSKLKVIKEKLDLDEYNIVPYNTPKKELRRVRPPKILKPKETIKPPSSY